MSATPEIQKTSSLIKGAEGVAVFATIILCVIGALVIWQYTVKAKAGWASKDDEAVWISLLVLSVLGFAFSLIYWAILGSQNTTIREMLTGAGNRLTNFYNTNIAPSVPQF